MRPAPLQLTSCPECGSPAEIERRWVLESTSGPIEHVKVRCIRKHWFAMPSSVLDDVCVRPALGRPRPTAADSR